MQAYLRVPVGTLAAVSISAISAPAAGGYDLPFRRSPSAASRPVSVQKVVVPVTKAKLFPLKSIAR